MAIYNLEGSGWSTKDLNKGRYYRLLAGISKHKETFKFLACLLEKGTKIRFWKPIDVVWNHSQENFPTCSPCY